MYTPEARTESGFQRMKCLVFLIEEKEQKNCHALIVNTRLTQGVTGRLSPASPARDHRRPITCSFLKSADNRTCCRPKPKFEFVQTHSQKLRPADVRHHVGPRKNRGRPLIPVKGWWAQYQHRSPTPSPALDCSSLPTTEKLSARCFYGLSQSVRR